ncbi:uncharacterized protein LACBIDRAFT_323223 [Laccaria bicolor S238N-H82]|uniref:Predicted protein n=1 Tax=Laccaria bicolor (strain S238N-H82 / ATCC MYA-4686) TaxID=486041 RepID=B0CZI0_LACBS|nr:uncharacterized protein LACBIDRAFT_323223 [Laccaria bicolor S238N-H82]EDR12628.1 predicted protein [Laccaria bicolor S238N-H82]|eukprot:XP_001876892.1 predicted protein [Laccaria bicolor S238N-H82]
MSKSSTPIPPSGTTNTSRGKETALDTSTQNVFTPGTPDIPEDLDMTEVPFFNTVQGPDQETPIPSMVEPEHPDIEDLTELGTPFAFEDLPDRGSYREIFIEFPGCMPFSSFGETVTDTGFDRSEKIFALAGRHRQALQLGEAALRRPIYNSYNKVVTRKGRKDLFKEEMDTLKELLSRLYYFNDESNVAGFALQRIILVNLNHQLKARRNEAEEDFIISGEGVPTLPRWGLNSKADEFWSANDFEILGACFRREVENFLAYLAEHHDFSKAKKGNKHEQRTTIITKPSHKKVISAHLSRNKGHANRFAANRNTSVFGHPAQNSSSHTFKELFGVRQGEDAIESQNGDDDSVHSGSHKSGTGIYNQQGQRRSGGDPGDPDGSDSDDGGSNGPRRGPKRTAVPDKSRRNPFETTPEGGNSTTVKAPPEPQFDTKLKMDTIPTWDGNPENLRRWLLKINSLAKRSTIVFKQLGSAEIWYYSQSVDTRDRIEQDWSTLRAAIGEYYMNRAFLDRQKARANRASYRDMGNGRETPKRELINEIMEGAPSFWATVVTPHLLLDLEQFQLSVKFHEDSLLRLGGGENSLNRQVNSNYSKDNSQRNPYNPFRNARVNLVGWTKAASNPQFPKDDANVSPRGTPEEKGARPCRHCGSGKHWDKDCRHARKGEKRARVNAVTTTAEEDRAEEEYDNIYYERFSDEEDIEDNPDFPKPSQP